MIPDVGVEFVAECVSGYNLRYSHAIGTWFQARLRRLPEGTDMDDACAVPYFILEDDIWRETYQHCVLPGQVVCEFLGDYLSPEQEAEQFKEELLGRHNVFTIDDAVNLRDKLNRYLEGQGVGDVALLNAIPDPALGGHPLPGQTFQDSDYPNGWIVDDAKGDVVTEYVGQYIAQHIASAANTAPNLQAENERLVAENTRLNQQIAEAKEAMRGAIGDLQYYSCICLRRMQPVIQALGVE